MALPISAVMLLSLCVVRHLSTTAAAAVSTTSHAQLSSAPKDNPLQGPSPSHNKRYHANPKTSILVSALHSPDLATSPMLLVDLSALRNHQSPTAFNADIMYNDNPISRSSTSSSSGDSSDTWDYDSMAADERYPNQRYLNEIGDSERLLVPFLPENTVGLHYGGGMQFLEDVLQLQRQSSREDAFSDFIRDNWGVRGKEKRGVFVSRSWLPGGHPEPQRSQKASLRRPSAAKHVGAKALDIQERPALPLIFSSKGWHAGGRKRNIFFSRGWGPGGRPLGLREDDGNNKKSTLPHRAEGVLASESMVDQGKHSSRQLQKQQPMQHVQFPRRSIGGEDRTVTQEAASHAVDASGAVNSEHRPRQCQKNLWAIPHLFGPYW
ncbi:uncharacterized protein LOC120836461 [Ixodes scapularis]|uniref:uncharacterized protein LOC120836461 n=1 Tax=Ixodes scapularis TaxID=6945 RepID=UPI001C3938BE|nr:uncharacterized protein LOC120836461 [Ixodes scapularis]